MRVPLNKPAFWVVTVCFVVVGGGICKIGNDFVDTITDANYYRFEREHHLPHRYRYEEGRNLTNLRQAVLSYCQAHDGKFPPMNSMIETGTALTSYLKNAKHYRNRVTNRPYVPNVKLNGKRYRDIKSPDKTLLFSDPNPPDTYKEVYFVVVSGRVDHVALKDWEATKQTLISVP